MLNNCYFTGCAFSSLLFKPCWSGLSLVFSTTGSHKINVQKLKEPRSVWFLRIKEHVSLHTERKQLSNSVVGSYLCQQHRKLQTLVSRRVLITEEFGIFFGGVRPRPEQTWKLQCCWCFFFFAAYFRLMLIDPLSQSMLSTLPYRPLPQGERHFLVIIHMHTRSREQRRVLKLFKVNNFSISKL